MAEFPESKPTEAFTEIRKSNSQHAPSEHGSDVPTGILVSFDVTTDDKSQDVNKAYVTETNMDPDSTAGSVDDGAMSAVELNGRAPLKTIEEAPSTESGDCQTHGSESLQNNKDSFKLCGYLDKLGEKGILKTYKKRWFVFDNQRCMLCYYRSHQFIVPLGSIPIANATFSFNPADSERPGNFSITVDGRVYQLQAEDYHTKMYWLQELQEKRKSYSQLRTSLARDSTKRSSVEPSTGLVSTKKMKEKGGDPWAGLPPLLQPVDTPFHSVGEETAGTARGGISFNSLKADLKNIRPWKSSNQDSFPQFQQNQVQTEPTSPQQPNAPPIPKPRKKHQAMVDAANKRPTNDLTNRRPATDAPTKRPSSILQRLSTFSTSDHCLKCSQLLSQISSLQEELDVVDSEAKASQQVTKILHTQLTEVKIQQSTNMNFLECKSDKEKLMLLHRKDKQLVQLEQLLQEVKYDREEMKKELRACQAKITDLEENISMFRELLVAKDEIVMDLTLKVNELERAPPITARTVNDTAPMMDTFPGDNVLLVNTGSNPNSPTNSSPPKPNAFYVERREHEKVKDACQAFETQNKFLNKEILELNELRVEGQLRENTYEEKLDEMEAELYKLNAKHLLLLNELKAPKREVTSMEDQDDLVSQLIEEAIQSGGRNEEHPSGENIGRELYDKYGFTENMDEDGNGPDMEDVLVNMAAECQKKADQISLKQQQSDQSISQAVKWENFIISGRNKQLVRTPELKYLVRLGIPHEHRSMIWKECINRRVKSDKEECGPGYYQTLCACAKNQNTHNPAVKQIELDLLRTLPNNKHYDKITSSGIPKLRNVLLAYSIHNPAIGYCQGLNRLAAIALLYLEEEDVFWCLVCIIEHIMPVDYYSKTLVGSQTDQKVLKDLLAEKLPRLNTHLDNFNIDLSLVTFNWFITIFCDNIPVETMLRIWDTFLFEGDKVMFRYALAFFKVAEEKLLSKKDYLSIFSILRQLPTMMKDAQKISQIAFHDLNPFPRKNITTKRAFHRQQVMQQLEELEAIRREFVPRHSRDNMLGSDDEAEEFETLDIVDAS